MTPCPRCNDQPIVTPDLAGYGYHVVCENCYDGAPDATTRNELAFATTKAEAAIEWNRMVDEGFIGGA